MNKTIKILSITKTVLPNSFAAHTDSIACHSFIESLGLSYNARTRRLSDTFIRSASHYIQIDEYLRVINLSSNMVEKDWCTLITNSLKSNKSLINFDLRNNRGLVRTIWRKYHLSWQVTWSNHVSRMWCIISQIRKEILRRIMSTDLYYCCVF